MLQPLPNKPEAAGEATSAATLSGRRNQRLQALGAERARFRALIGKVGSGEHTSTGLSREEAREALGLMLQGQISDAQMGAFLIAHRIRRPQPLELAGMLDSYRNQGPVLATSGRRALCFGVPYDGDPMPVKFGVTLAELFTALGIHWQGRALTELQQGLDRHGLALTHQPEHFPAAERLLSVRDEIGKRPPIASLELLWTPHRGEHLLVSGFVHQPTEQRAWEALAAAGETDVLTVKGLEGSTDLPTSRTGITGRFRGNTMERLLLHPRDHGVHGEDIPWSSLETWREQALAALAGDGPLAQALVWNLGCFLWLAYQHPSLAGSMDRARALVGSRSGERLRRELLQQAP